MTARLRQIPASIARDAEVSASVAAAVAALVDAAPGTLDTLNEIAAALADDPNFAATMIAALGGKQPLDAELTAIAALSTTPYGRAFLTLIDAPAARTALALGTAATANTGDFEAAGIAILKSLVDAAGDLLVGTADNTVGRLGKGTALQLLRVNAAATALEWATVTTDVDDESLIVAAGIYGG